MNNAYKIWSDWEKAYLLNNYLFYSDADMAVFLNKRTSQVTNFRCRLKLIRPSIKKEIQVKKIRETLVVKYELNAKIDKEILENLKKFDGKLRLGIREHASIIVNKYTQRV